jgi:hypothetical protein
MYAKWFCVKYMLIEYVELDFFNVSEPEQKLIRSTTQKRGQSNEKWNNLIKKMNL